MKPIKKIYYIPGIITLVIAPILLTVKINNYILERREYCISMGKIPFDDDGFFTSEFLPKRDYHVFRLTGQPIEDSLKLLLIENYAKGLSDSKNDSIGLKVELNNKLKYKTYIDLLNTCLKSDISNWIHYGDTLFILNKEYPNNYDHKACQNIMFPNDLLDWGPDCCFSFEKSKPTLIQKIKNESYKIKLAIPYMILILILAYQNIIFIKRNRG